MATEVPYNKLQIDTCRGTTDVPDLTVADAGELLAYVVGSSATEWVE